MAPSKDHKLTHAHLRGVYPVEAPAEFRLAWNRTRLVALLDAVHCNKLRALSISLTKRRIAVLEKLVENAPK